MDPTTLLERQLEELQRVERDARAAYDAVRQRIAELGDEPEGEPERSAYIETVRTVTADLETTGQALEDAHGEMVRVQGNLDAERRRAEIPVSERRRPAQSVRSEREELVYSPQSGFSFFADAYRFQYSADPGARERLERHGRQNVDLIRAAASRESDRRRREFEERYQIEAPEMPYQFRDVGTGAFAGLTVPQYLIDLFAPLARAGAPLLQGIARKLPLPESGMTLNISRITTGTAVAAQAAENDAVQETNIDDTLLTINVRTYAGMQDVSRQAIERSEMVDTVVFQDLISDYFTKIDSAIINADGTLGTHLGIRSTSGIVAVTYTDASPTLPELYPKVADAIQQIATSRFAPATTVVMHPRRWGWATAALDSSNRPLVVPNAQGPYNALAVGDAPEYGAVVGTMQGLPVITDANLPTNLGAGTNEDLILVERMPDLLYWQEGDGAPRQFRFEQSNAPQSIRLAVWGYSAFAAGRYPAANATIGGTGLVTPTF